MRARLQPWLPSNRAYVSFQTIGNGVDAGLDTGRILVAARCATRARATDHLVASLDRYAAAKRASMRAHASQATADEGDRTLAAFLRIPRPAYDLVFGREWFRDPDHPVGAPLKRDIFEGLT